MNWVSAIALMLGTSIFFADFLSKYWIANTLPRMLYMFPWYPYGGVGIFQNFLGVEFSLVHATNSGAAWGILAQWQQELLYLRLFLIGGLFMYLFFFNQRRSWQIPLTLILAGALGNVLDFFLYGHVIDMFHFVFWGYNYPVFNIADSAIFLGIAWLILSSARSCTHGKLA